VGYFAKKVDKNQAEIVEVLRWRGLSVQLLHDVGKGVPDAIVSSETDMCFVEFKSQKGKLNQRQQKWWDEWRGKPPVILRSIEDAKRFKP
jgi:hypothetical protein